uniref:Uncharacterized protein n=1 Tax=Clytia hemisphaerica TaxID=252671 RepID=A0A7M5XGK1_9CNID
IICDIFKSVPYRTPKRLEIIKGLVAELIEEFNGDCQYSTVSIIVDIYQDEKQLNNSFHINDIGSMAEHMHRFTNIDSCKHNSLHRVLLPTSLFCCDKLIKIEGRKFAHKRSEKI